MSKSVIVIGGGVIGLCTAYYLQKEGCKVTVVDQSNMDAGASYVNAGYLSPSHIIPLASPGMVKKGIKWMFDSTSPLYIKPRLEPDFLKWAWAFHKSCNPKHVERSIPIIKDIAKLSQELFDAIKATEKFNFHYEKKGLLMLCQTDKALSEEVKIAKLANDINLEVELLNTEEVQTLEPNIKVNTVGATFYKCDSHTTPHEFMNDMKKYLKEVGVTIIKNEKVEDLDFSNGKIATIRTAKRQLKADEFVLAAGSWSPLISQKIGLKMLMQAGKGYRINSPKTTNIKYPAILVEKKIAVTPMNGFTRFAGTMEIAGINQKINKVRVDAIASGCKQYYPEVILDENEKNDAASGLRPVSPDGLPYIGRSKKCKNLTIATGHAMMGWSMATATGKLVTEIISNKKPSLNLNYFHPDRKF